MIGKTLGHYQISSQLGKGGMGEVYQAKDQVLGRDVAIKVLPEEFARDADRVARFQREAKLLASLNHPNIASIYGLEESGEINFLVLELVEGETLADTIKRGPIPVGEALKLALQIAEALEAAHEKGIIHRDLKPANIKITPEGKAKVLDVGLAKALGGEQETNLSNSPTLSQAATMQGVILGTAAYMSPEQARGKPVDKRADIWAFGVVLYEMLTGKSLFEGQDVTSTLARVLERNPDFSTLPENLHPRIRLLLERCLKKESRDRYSGIGDARVDIQEALADPGGVFAQPMVRMESGKKPRSMLPWMVAALGIVAVGMAAWYLKPAPSPGPARVVRFTYEVPESRQFNKGWDGQDDYALAVSPDGSQFVYGTTEGLYIRSLDALEARPIAGSDKTATLPIFSPDGRWIAYFSPNDQKLKKISINGGAPVALCGTGPLIPGMRWDSDSTIVYADVASGVMRISAAGGTPESLVKGSIANIIKEGLPLMPQILPDGKTLLFTNVFNVENLSESQIVIQRIGSNERKVLFKGGVALGYVPTGHIVYALTKDNIGTLYAMPFDLDKLKITGGPIPLLEGFRAYAFFNSGTLVYVPSPQSVAGGSERALVWVDRHGKETPIAASPKDYRNPKISPDGNKMAVAFNAGGKSDIWIWDFLRENMTRLTLNEPREFPLWTLDGKRVAFSGGATLNEIYWKSADGTGEEEKLGSAPSLSVIPSSWARDGKTLVAGTYDIGGAGVNLDIGLITPESKGEWKPLLKESYIEAWAEISPDGRWMAYQSDVSGKPEVYVRPFPDVNKGKSTVSTTSGTFPLWSPDGRELFYRNGDAVMAVKVETDPAFKPGKPEVLFQGKYVQLTNRATWAIGRDGRFLMMKAVESAGKAPAAESPRKIHVVLNWLEELKPRVPTK